MKKILLLFVIMFILIAFTACGNQDITLNFYVDNELLESIDLDSDSDLPQITAPEKTGYNFEGWYIDKNFSQKFTSIDEKQKSLNLYARYIRKTYTVTFVAEGFQDITRSVSHGDSLADIPSVPEKEGYTGVWEQSDLSSVTSDMTIDAEYTIIELTIVFKAQGFDDITKTIAYGQPLTDIPEVPQKEGKLGEWDQIDFNSITQNLVVNAVYTDIIITVSFVSQLGEQTYIDTVEIIYNTSLDSSDIPQPHNFEGHYFQWEDFDLSNLKTDITVYAIYTPFVFNVSFYDWNNNFLTTVEAEYGAILEEVIGNLQQLDESIKDELLNPNIPSHLDDPINANFRYGNKDYDLDIYTPLTRNASFTLIFDSTIKVTIFANGGELIDDIEFIDEQEKEVSSGTSLFYMDVKDRYGYAFEGWYTVDYYDPQNFDPATVPEENMIEINIASSLYQNTMIIAKWEKLYIDISFPNIDNITFIINDDPLPNGGIQTIEYGNDISFAIDTQLQLLKVMTNTSELFASQGLYTINQLEQNTIIAIKTQEIDIHTLRFYSEDKSRLLYAFNISQNQILDIIPELPRIYGANGEWICDDENYTYETPVTKSMDFEAFYEYSYYPVYFYYYYNSSYDQTTVQYGDTSFRLLSPPPREGYLFEGWYVSPQFVERASVEYVINMGRTVNLYANWIEEKDYEHPIIGRWYSDNMILTFQTNGLVQINDYDYFFECAYTIIDEDIFILDKEVTFDGENIVYDSVPFTKTSQPVTIIRFSNVGYYTIVGEEIPYIDEVFDSFWYTEDYQYSNMFDLFSKIDFELIENNFIRLYPYEKRLVEINYTALNGNIQYNIESQIIYIDENSSLPFTFYDEINDLPLAFRDNHNFIGWIIEGTNIIMDKSYLLNNYATNLRVEAKFAPSDMQSPQNTIEAFYYKYDESQQKIITAEFFEDGWYLITFIDPNTNAFYRYSPLYYFWEDDEFRDENDNLISFNNDSVTFLLDEQQITLNKPLFDVQHPYYFYSSSSEGDDYDFIHFDLNTIFINMTDERNAVQLGSHIYYIESLYYPQYDEGICGLKIYDIDELIALNEQIPELFLGSFEGELTTIPDEGGEEIHYDIEIVINSDNSAQLIYNEDFVSESLVFYYQEQLIIIDEMGQKFPFWYDEDDDIFILDTIIFLIEFEKVI